MSSVRQIDANRRNALRSTGPITQEGKSRSRLNAVRHGLSAETVVGALEDAEDYQAFQMTVTTDYDPQSAVERELILRLASLLWRLRRATAIETGLFQMQARELLKFRRPATRRLDTITDFRRRADAHDETPSLSCSELGAASAKLTESFVRLNELEACPLHRLSRYEGTLWRQARQILLVLHGLNRRWSRRMAGR